MSPSPSPTPALLALLAALAAAPPLAQAARRAELLPAHARGGAQYAELLAEDAAGDAALAAALGLRAGWTANTSGVFKPTLVDHFTAGAAQTFQQRFFFDTTFCGANCSLPSTPIVCEMTGEWTARGAPSGASAELGAALGALLVTVEHRAYGCSQFAGGCAPPADASENVKYLSVEQAIEDSADFIPYFEAFAANGLRAPAGSPPAWAPGFAPARRWAIAGGSYAGAFVTWFTVRHGDLVKATWASSGVVQATFNFSGFDRVVAEAVGPDCTLALLAVTDAFEAAWAARNADLLALFNATYAGLTKGDFAWMLSDSAGMAPQYGAKKQLCAFLNSTARDTPSSPTPPGGGGYPTGWAALQAFAAWTSYRYGPGFGASCYYSTACLSSKANASQWSDTTTWVLQCCNELAYWNIANIGPLRTRSTILTSDYFMSQCAAVYPGVVPDTAAFNARFGGASPLVGSSKYTRQYPHPPPTAALTLTPTRGRLRPALIPTTDQTPSLPPRAATTRGFRRECRPPSAAHTWSRPQRAAAARTAVTSPRRTAPPTRRRSPRSATRPRPSCWPRCWRRPPGRPPRRRHRSRAPQSPALPAAARPRSQSSPALPSLARARGGGAAAAAGARTGPRCSRVDLFVWGEEGSSLLLQYGLA